MSGVQSKADLLLESLNNFYADINNLRRFTDIRKSKKISLRVYDWYVCNYSKRFDISYPIEKSGVIEIFKVYLEYKAQLRRFSKRFFDPFSRREKIMMLDADGDTMKTTISQLNFFRWALTNKVVDYIITNLKAIDDDMMQSTQEKVIQSIEAPKLDSGSETGGSSSSSSRKKREIRTSRLKGYTNTNLKVTVRFT